MEVRAATAEVAELKEQLATREKELNDAMNKRNEFERKLKDLQNDYDKVAPPTLDGRRTSARYNEYDVGCRVCVSYTGVPTLGAWAAAECKEGDEEGSERSKDCGLPSGPQAAHA